MEPTAAWLVIWSAEHPGRCLGGEPDPPTP